MLVAERQKKNERRTRDGRKRGSECVAWPLPPTMSSFPLFSASQPNPRRSYVSMQPILASPVRPHLFTSTSQGASSGRRRSAGYSPPRSSTSSSPSSSSKRNEALWDEAIEKRAFNDQLTPPKSGDEHEGE